MTRITPELRTLLLKLPSKEKIKLAQELIASIPADEEVDAFIAELERRDAEFESGDDPGIPAEEVFRELREKYG